LRKYYRALHPTLCGWVEHVGIINLSILDGQQASERVDAQTWICLLCINKIWEDVSAVAYL
jgi:hypothetical protein